MPRIVYYVAASLDGYIAGPNEDISSFIPSGPGVDQYLSDLAQFQTVIMGRRTYEFGYQFGLKPGQPAYPHMTHYLFSSKLQLPEKSDLVQIRTLSLQTIEEIKAASDSDIYLCGGGLLAGWLLENKCIDVLKIKLNPIILGSGTPLFANMKSSYQCSLSDQQRFDDGLQILTYNLQYQKG